MRIKRWNGDNSKFIFRRGLKRRRLFRSLVIWGFVTLIVGGGIGWAAVWAVNYPHFRVSAITVAGTRAISADEVRGKTKAYLSGYTSVFIPRDEIFFISTNDLAVVIANEFPRVKEVTIEKKWPQELAITIRERDLWGLACEPAEKPVEKELPVSVTGQIIFDDEENTTPAPGYATNKCLFIDEDGFAFEALEGVGNGILPVIYKRIGEYSSGSAVIEKSYIDYFEKVKKLLSASGDVSLVGVAIEDENPKDYKLMIAGDWYILVVRADDPEVWAKQLKILIATKLQGGMDSIEYIDLRFGNKVFYKLKDESTK